MKHALPRLLLLSLIVAVRAAHAAPAWPDMTMRDNMIIQPEKLMQALPAPGRPGVPRLRFVGYAVASGHAAFRPTPLPDPDPIPEPPGLSLLAVGGLVLVRFRHRRGKADPGRG